MNREEAIAILNHNVSACLHGTEWGEALEMAIEALSTEPILEKINKMKSEIADSLEFWGYSPNNNPLARDMLETLTNYFGNVRGEEV